MKTKDLIERLKRFLQSLEEFEKLYLNSLYNGEVITNDEEIERQEKELCQ